ncbi:MAG: MFS transporter [Acidimicrobiales bacterium]
MTSLDVTVVNVALPSIGRSFHAQVSGLQWTVDAYTLVLASVLMLSGSTADRVGRRRTFTTGLVVFSAASLLCSLAANLPMLVVFRAVQALGGSMLAPVAMSILTNTFTDPRERAQAIGIWGSVNGVSLALGPVVGGALVSAAGWRAVFWVNVPVGLAATVLAVRYLPESRAARARRPDLVGQAMLVVLLAAVTYGIIEAPDAGLSSPLVLAMAGIAVVAIVAFLLYEQRRDEPLLDLRFFRSVPFTAATVTAVAVFSAMGGFLFMNTLYLQEARGLSALDAGLATLPVAVVATVFSPLSGRLVGRRGSRVPLVVAGAALIVSMLLLAQMTTNTSYDWLLVAYVVFGTAYGFANAPITNNAVSGMPREQAGVASAIASMSRQVGSTLGVAVAGAIVASTVAGHHLGARLASATHPAWYALVGCGVVVLAVGFVSTSRWARATAERTARQLNPEAISGELIE